MASDLTPTDRSRIDDHLADAGYNTDEYNLSLTNGVVSIQFHVGFDDRFGAVLTALAEQCYYYSVDSVFECPPKVRVDGKQTLPEGVAQEVRA